MQEYFETQYIRKTKLGILLNVVILIVMGLTVYNFFVENHGLAEKIFVSMVLISVLLLFYFMKLEYKITNEKIEYKYFPFHRKWRSVDRSEVANISFVKYSALKEYGGWGIKYGRKGIAYNVSGNYGIFVELKSGKTMMLGTVKYKELCE
jgi:hypothetical protein